MRICVDYKGHESDIDQLKIMAAKYLSNYAIRVKFSDGSDKIVDFKLFLTRSIESR